MRQWNENEKWCVHASKSPGNNEAQATLIAVIKYDARNLRRREFPVHVNDPHHLIGCASHGQDWDHVVTSGMQTRKTLLHSLPSRCRQAIT